MEEFDGSILSLDESADGFFNRDDGCNTAAFDRRVKEAAYTAEIAEIERLTETLQSGLLVRTDLSPEAREKGLAILKARRELVDSLYDGRSIQEIRESEFEKRDRVYELQTGQPIPPRQKAIIRELETYQSDAPCRNGHENPERSTSNGVCIECRQARNERINKKAETAAI